jgi:uncharacterized membrane protein
MSAYPDVHSVAGGEGQIGQSLTRTERQIPHLFLLVALLFGCSYAIFLPPNQVPDEFKHFLRSIDVASGYCVGHVSTRTPISVFNMLQAFPSKLEDAPPSTRWLTAADYSPWLDEPLAPTRTIEVDAMPATIYTCVPYLPSGIAIAVAKEIAAPPLILFWAGRLTNLVVFVALVFLALRWLPDFRMQLLGLALMPMTLTQAASFSADAMTLSTSFLLIAYILRLSFDGNILSIERRGFVILGLLSLFCALTKFNIWLELLVLLIPAAKFRGRRDRLVFVLSMLLICIIAGLSWQALNSWNMHLFFQDWLGNRSINARENANWLSHHPGLFLTDIWLSVATFPKHYLTMFVGMLGWVTMPLPFNDVIAYVAVLVVVALTQTERTRLCWRSRTILGILFIASCISLFTLLFEFETTATYIQRTPPVAAGIPGLQGRYFIPFALLLLLFLSSRRIRLSSRIALVGLLVVATVANATAIELVWKEFYQDGLLKKLNGHALLLRDGRMFLSANGELHYIPDPRTLNVLGVGSHVNKQDGKGLTGFKVGAPLPSISTRLIRDSESKAVFLLAGGFRHYVPDPPTLQALKLPDTVVDVPRSVIDSIPEGDALPHSDPDEKIEVVRTDLGRTFLLAGNVLHLIPDAKTLSILGLSQSIRRVNEREFGSLQMGAPLPGLPSRLLLDQETQTIFVVEGGRLHGIPDPPTLFALGLSDPVVDVPKAVINAIPLGAVLPHSDKPIPKKVTP